MAKIVNAPSARKTTLLKTFAIGKLPSKFYGEQKTTDRKTPVYTIGVDAAFDSDTGDQLDLTLDLINGEAPGVGDTVYLDAGLTLTFTGNKVLKIAEGVTLEQTATTVTVIDPETQITLADTDISTNKCLLFVHGCSNATVSPQIQNEDGTTYTSGTNKVMVTVSNAKQISFEFKEIYGDIGGETLRSIMFNDDDIGKEFYCEVVEPDGEKHEGVAILNDASPQGSVQQLKTISGTAQFQTYIHTDATIS